MEHISIFNYEIFYLDYLEGNLNEEETAMLFGFLEQHPECMLDNHELPVLSENDCRMSADLKKKLHQTDESGPVTHETLEHFLIAKAEGLLSQDKQMELDRFVRVHDLSEHEKLVGMTYFTADPAEKYAHKSELKQVRRIVLWPYVAAAASIALLFMLFNLLGTGHVSDTNQQLAEQPTNKGSDTGEQAIPQKVESIQEAPQHLAVEKMSAGVVNGDQKVPAPERNHVGYTAHEKLPTRRLMSMQLDDRIVPVASQLQHDIAPEADPGNKQDVAYVAFDDLNNPIEPLTKVLSQKTRTDIDFRAGRSKVNKSKGFYLKIGKFEVSHRKH